MGRHRGGAFSVGAIPGAIPGAPLLPKRIRGRLPRRRGTFPVMVRKLSNGPMTPMAPHPNLPSPMQVRSPPVPYMR